MANYDVKHVCGHNFTHKLYKSHEERWRKIDNLKLMVCPDCFRKKKQKQELAESEKRNLPELKGSEKQITWALSIRNTQIIKLEETAERIKEISATNPQLANEALELIESVVNETDSRFWIENRYEMFDGQWIENRMKQK